MVSLVLLPGKNAFAGNPVFYSMPEILVNLKSGGSQRVYMKLVAVLDLPQEQDVKTIQKVLPRVMDAFQSYLRGLSAKDVEGREGLEMLRSELLKRIGPAAAPANVVNVLIKEMLVQ